MTSIDLEQRLTNARQNVMLLRSQILAEQIDPPYFLNRLDDLSNLLEVIVNNRREHAGAERFTKLYEVSRMIGSSLDLEEVLNSVMDAIIELTEAERGFLMLLNDDGVLEVRTARNFDQETLDSSDFAVSRTINRQVFESGEPVVTTNAQEDPRYAGQASIVAHQLRSIMAAPLRARGNTIGVIYVDNRVRTGLFRESDLELLEAFAGQAGVAIENARLFAETDEALSKRMEELKTLQWIDRQLSESLDVQKVMDLAVEWSLRMCNAQSASLVMRAKDSETLVLQAQAGQAAPMMEDAAVLQLSHPVIQQVMKTQQPVLAHHQTDEPAVLCVPIRHEADVVGLILLAADDERVFDEDAQALVTRMADRASIAIENGRLYDELKRANQAKSEFVGTVAHELKVPMTSVRGYADLLLQFSELDERSEGFVGRIKSSVTRMQTLVEDLSDISRIESGNLRVEITEVDLREVIESAKASTQAQIEQRGHQLREVIEDDLPLVRADPARAMQVLVNLLSNAYKYTPNGGTITIQTQQADGLVQVSIVDTGVGMTADELDQLGTKFWRSTDDHAIKQRGTGLGFSITRQLIELMDGTLDVQSVKGQGSQFTVGLPIR